MDTDAITRLENWKFGHKSRSVKIDHDNGYGASCWTVELCTGNKVIGASEVSFLVGRPADNWVACRWGDDDGKEYRWKDGEYKPVTEDQEDDDWCGLAGTIHAAIDRAEQLGFP